MKVIIDYELMGALAKLGASVIDYEFWKEKTKTSDDLYFCAVCGKSQTDIDDVLEHHSGCLVDRVCHLLENQPTRRLQKKVAAIGERVATIGEGVTSLAEDGKTPNPTIAGIFKDMFGV